VTIKLKLITH